MVLHGSTFAGQRGLHMSLDEHVGEDKHHAESFKPGALALIQLASYALEGSYEAIETSLGN